MKIFFKDECINCAFWRHHRCNFPVEMSRQYTTEKDIQQKIKQQMRDRLLEAMNKGEPCPYMQPKPSLYYRPRFPY